MKEKSTWPSLTTILLYPFQHVKGYKYPPFLFLVFLGETFSTLPFFFTLGTNNTQPCKYGLKGKLLIEQSKCLQNSKTKINSTRKS